MEVLQELSKLLFKCLFSLYCYFFEWNKNSYSQMIYIPDLETSKVFTYAAWLFFASALTAHMLFEISINVSLI